jgi:tetratricopeptide (TPR) repeat protein
MFSGKQRGRNQTGRIGRGKATASADVQPDSLHQHTEILKGPEIELKEADCAFALEWYHGAKKIYQNLAHTRVAIQAMIGVARCFHALGQDHLAHEQFNSIPGAKSDYRVLLAEAQCYQESRAYDSAIALYDRCMTIKDCGHIAVSKAGCLQEMGLYNRALQVLDSALYRHEKAVQRQKGLVYQALGRFEEALNIFLAQSQSQSKLDYLTLAQCYEAMGNHPEAVRIYNRIANTTTDRDAILGRARCYLHMGLHEDAIRTCTLLENWRQDKAFLLLVGRGFEKQGDYLQAFGAYSEIDRTGKDKEANLARARLQRKQKRGEAALKTLDAIAITSQNCNEVLLERARIYDAMGLVQRAANAYRLVCKKYPYDSQADYHFCRFAAEKGMVYAADLLEKKLQKWPNMKKLRVLKSQYTQAFKPTEIPCSLTQYLVQDLKIAVYGNQVNPRLAFFEAEQKLQENATLLIALDLATTQRKFR